MVMVRFSRVRLAALPMGHPQLRWSLLLMEHHEGKALKYQVKQERLTVLPLNPMESENSLPGALSSSPSAARRSGGCWGIMVLEVGPGVTVDALVRRCAQHLRPEEASS